MTISRTDKVLKLINTDHLIKDEKYSLQRVCANYVDVFHKCTAAVYIKPYRLPQSQEEEVNKQIQKMLDGDIIEEARSPWSI